MHRREIHKYVRHQDVDVNELLQLEHDTRIQEIASIISHNPMSKEYKAEFTDGTVDYITILDDENEAVRAYLSAKVSNIDVFDASGAVWMRPVWEPV